MSKRFFFLDDMFNIKCKCLNWNFEMYTLLFCLFLMIITFISSENVRFGFPFFGHTEIRDPTWDTINGSCFITNEQCERVNFAKNNIDIQFIDYFSNDKFLNFTLWFLRPLGEIPSNQTVIYGLDIDADSNSETGQYGNDFAVEYSQENGEWKRILNQTSSIATANRIIEVSNVSNFYKQDNNFLELYIDLDKIGNPGKYQVMVYSIDKDSVKKLIKEIDFSTWIDIPPVPHQIETIPEAITLRPSENEEISIQVKSNGKFLNTAYFDIPQENQKPFVIECISCSKDDDKGLYKIQVPDVITPGKYNILIPVKITTNSSIKYVQEVQKSSLNTAITVTTIQIPITILPPWTLAEQFVNLWSTYGSPISFIFGIITGKIGGIIGSWLLVKIKQLRQN